MGCERSGPLGREGADCNCPNSKIAVQVKHREEVPKWLIDMVLQAEGDANTEQRPLSVLHPFGWETGESLVVIRLKSMRELLIKGGIITEPKEGKETENV